MRFFPSLRGEIKAAQQSGDSPVEGASRRQVSGHYLVSGVPYDVGGLDVERAVRDGMERVSLVQRCIHAIASDSAGLRMIVRQDDPDDGALVENLRLLRVLNRRANPNVGGGAAALRYRAGTQLLVSRKGVFVEVVMTNGGEPHSLYLLPPHRTTPVPDEKTVVSAFEVRHANGDVEYLPPFDAENPKSNSVLWIKRDHPLDPYASMTPLEPLGISVDTAFYSRLFNRNFMAADGRPGGILAVDGPMDPGDAMELKARFVGGPQGAGRLAVLETGPGGVKFVDTSTTPRDAQYVETMAITKEDILLGFGVPESQLGNAAGRTYDNADAEEFMYWRRTVRDHNNVLEAGLDPLTGPLDDDLFLRHDYSTVAVLQRDEERRKNEARLAYERGEISLRDLRIATGQQGEDDGEWDVPGARVLWLPAGKIPLGATPEDQAAATQLLTMQVGQGQPADPSEEARAGAIIGSQAGATAARNDWSARAVARGAASHPDPGEAKALADLVAEEVKAALRQWSESMVVRDWQGRFADAPGGVAGTFSTGQEYADRFKQGQAYQAWGAGFHSHNMPGGINLHHKHAGGGKPHRHGGLEPAYAKPKTGAAPLKIKPRDLLTGDRFTIDSTTGDVTGTVLSAYRLSGGGMQVSYEDEAGNAQIVNIDASEPDLYLLPFTAQELAAIEDDRDYENRSLSDLVPLDEVWHGGHLWTVESLDDEDGILNLRRDDAGMESWLNFSGLAAERVWATRLPERKALNVPPGGAARKVTTGVLGVEQATAQDGTTYEFHYAMIDAKTLEAGDVVLVNGQEDRGPLVVTRLAPDSKHSSGNLGVYGTWRGAGSEEQVFLALDGRSSRVQIDPPPPKAKPKPRSDPSTGIVARYTDDPKGLLADARNKAFLAEWLRPAALPTSNTGQSSVAGPGQQRGFGANMTGTTDHLPDDHKVYPDRGDQFLASLLAAQGFDGLPDLVDDDELDKYVQAGEIEGFRGLSGGTSDGSLDDGITQFQAGQYYPGTGMYGNGTYVAMGLNAVQSFREASGYSSAYTASDGGGVMRMTLKASARVATYTEIQQAMRQFARSSDPIERAAAHDEGWTATLLGFDAIRTTAYGQGNAWSSMDYVVVLNRTALRVSKKAHRTPRAASAYESALQSRGF